MNARAGFSLVEALVAIVIAAVALAAVFELQQQLVRGEARSEAVLVRARLQRNVLAITRDLNPMVEPSGAVTLGGGRSVRWTSVMIAPARPDAGPTGPKYDVALYRVETLVTDGDGRVLAQVEFERPGWRRGGAGGVPAAGRLSQ